MYNSRVVGSTIRKVQIYFRVQTEKNIRNLDQNQVEFYKAYKIILTKKLIRSEHTKRIGFVGRINQRIASTT